MTDIDYRTLIRERLCADPDRGGTLVNLDTAMAVIELLIGAVESHAQDHGNPWSKRGAVAALRAAAGLEVEK